MSAIELCRTAALGGHVEACEDCAHTRVAYNSCRNRHCPSRNATRERWLADRQADLMPVPYFHVVFTVPPEVAEIAFHNKAIVYAILFNAVAATLKTIAADPKHLGGEIGFLAILHTWGQALTHHPHIHCLVPGGALSPDGRWLSCRPNFFLPIRVLSRLFRRLFLKQLQAAHAAGQLRFSGALDRLGDADVFMATTRQLRRKNWVVYSKPPFGSPERVLAYLGRYTHRVAIANSRRVGAALPSSLCWAGHSGQRIHSASVFGAMLLRRLATRTECWSWMRPGFSKRAHTASASRVSIPVLRGGSRTARSVCSRAMPAAGAMR